MAKKKDGIPKVEKAYYGKLNYAFLFSILLVLGAIVLWILRPFLIDIILAGILASFFYPVYKKILKYIPSKGVSSFITLLLVVAIIVFPIVQFFIYLVSQSVEAYNQVRPVVESPDFANQVKIFLVDQAEFLRLNPDQVIAFLNNLTGRINDILITVSTGIARGTTSFVVSTLIILLTMYFLFIDGKAFAQKIMSLTPLPNKYDRQIFTTFRETSYSALVSTVVAGLAQGVIGGIAFWIVGLPAFFAGVLIFVTSIIPYVGSGVVILPAAGYLLYTGDYVGAVILIVFSIIVAFSDNIIRAYMIKGKTKIHELVIFFAIIGGIVAFGFWGVLIGPIIVALLFTVIKIYEEEFSAQLEKAAE